MEHGFINRASDFPGRVDTVTDVYVVDGAFEYLKRCIASQEAEAVLSFTFRHGRECIRVKNYVGLLETRDGTQIEILPKITPPYPLNQEEALLHGNDIPSTLRKGLVNWTVPSRAVLLQMLSSLSNSPFREVGSAYQHPSLLPLWEIFIAAFLDEGSALVRQGLQKAYVLTSGNERFLKGKLQLSRQWKENYAHAERLAVKYDTVTLNLPHNRLLKSALLAAKQRARSLANQTRIWQLLFALDIIPASKQPNEDFRAVRQANRLYTRYESVVRWAEVLLANQSYGLIAGEHLTLSLLFPIERLFEAYVSSGFRRYCAGDVRIQESSQHLLADWGNGPTGSVQRFRLRPDILVHQNAKVIVLDVKWKQINATNTKGNYGIEPADLYQLFAYGKKYGASELVLIYPANEQFQRPLQLFGYDKTLPLRVVPFHLLNRLEIEISRISTP